MNEISRAHVLNRVRERCEKRPESRRRRVDDERGRFERGDSTRPDAQTRGRDDAPTSGPLGESWRAWTALFIGVLAVSAHAASSVTFSVLMKPILTDFGWQRTNFASAMTLRMASS